MDGLGLLACLGQDLAGVVEAMEGAGEFFDVAGNAVGFAEFGGGFDHGGVFAEGADECAFVVFGEQ